MSAALNVRTEDEAVMMKRLAVVGLFLAQAAVLTACDPLLTIQGSFWPPWIVSILSGMVLTVALSLVFAAVRIDPYLGHPLIVYTCLWALLTFTTWLVGYAR